MSSRTGLLFSGCLKFRICLMPYTIATQFTINDDNPCTKPYQKISHSSEQAFRSCRLFLYHLRPLFHQHTSHRNAFLIPSTTQREIHRRRIHGFHIHNNTVNDGHDVLLLWCHTSSYLGVRRGEPGCLFTFTTIIISSVPTVRSFDSIIGKREGPAYTSVRVTKVRFGRFGIWVRPGYTAACRIALVIPYPYF